MSVDRRLVRAYRRLIRFYPPGSRRAELLDTLIECAPVGRRRPTPAEIVNLVGHGSRARLGRPRSNGVVVLAVLISLAAGFVGASAASRLGLEAVGSLPVGTEAAEINKTVFPGLMCGATTTPRRSSPRETAKASNTGTPSPGPNPPPPPATSPDTPPAPGRVHSTLGAALGVAGAVCCVIGLLPAALFALSGGGAADETVSPWWWGLAYLGVGPAALAGVVAALMVAVVVLVKPPALLARGFRHVASWPDRMWRRPRVLVALIAAGAVVVGVGLYPVQARHLATGSCTPAVPSGVVDPPSAHLSYRSRNFIDPATPAEDRNLIEAAFRRGFGGGYDFSGAPTPGFTDAFCDHGRVAVGVVDTLPWYWSVDLASPDCHRDGQRSQEHAGLRRRPAPVQHLPRDS